MRRFRAWLVGLLSLNGSPRGIAGGFALGLGLSLVPIPVAGMLVALALAPIVRANPAATYLGSAVVNPFTGPAFYFLELWVGMWLWRLRAPSWEEMGALDGAGWWALFKDLLGPFLSGAALVVPVAAGLGYLVVLVLVQRWRAALDRAPPRAE